MTPATDLVSEHIGNFRQIDSNLFAGAQPQLCEGIDELIQKYKIKTIIDLQGHDVSRERDCTPESVDFFSVPLPGVEILSDPPRDKIERAMLIVNDPESWPVFVHCLHGSDRTGAIVGIYRVQHGATLKEAIEEMRKYHNSWIERGYRDAVEDFFEKHKG